MPPIGQNVNTSVVYVYIPHCNVNCSLTSSVLHIEMIDVRRFDIYRKIPKDLTQPTITGAIISICCCCFITLLFASEFYNYINPVIVSELYVDSIGNEEDKILVRLNITLPKLKCDAIGLDIQDDLGRHEVGFVENIEKIKIQNDGCQFNGRFYINKVPGNFHVSTHSATEQPDVINMEHHIQEVSFGERILNSNVPGSFNSLAGRTKIEVEENTAQLESHDYVMKIVPTIFEDLSGTEVITYQYTYAYRSYMSFSHTGHTIPAIWFRYDLTPITIKYHERRPRIYSFITTVCAIVGGTFTMAGILDSFIFTASEMFRKAELGKLS
uniref:Endoplasmic reticulum vesicle transporter C-terminal domain-containing protein n=1 Tax=Strigamia maritima TaxID=126957 RepID=T1IQS3_STRMM